MRSSQEGALFDVAWRPLLFSVPLKFLSVTLTSMMSSHDAAYDQSDQRIERTLALVPVNSSICWFNSSTYQTEIIFLIAVNTMLDRIARAHLDRE